MVLNRVVDGGSRKDGVELAVAGGGVVLGEDGVDDRGLGECFALLGWVLPIGPVIVDVKPQDVAILDGVGVAQRLGRPLEGKIITLRAYIGFHRHRANPLKPSGFLLYGL
jgi:hypothetical protein